MEMPSFARESRPHVSFPSLSRKPTEIMRKLINSLPALSFASALGVAALSSGAPLTYDETTLGDLPAVSVSSGAGDLGTLDLDGAVITGSIVGTDERDSIFFNSPIPFRLIVDSFAGSSEGMDAIGLATAFGSFSGDDIGRARLDPGVLFDGVGLDDSNQFAPDGVLPAGEYRFDLRPFADTGELTAYQVTVAPIPEPTAIAAGAVGGLVLLRRHR
ncbi:MAG: hypothetical protein AAF561_02340 [Planctomycetota bacterium]